MIRSRSDGQSSETATRNFKNTSTGYTLSLDGPCPTSWEQFSDEVRSDVRFKNCHHTKVWVTRESGYLIDGTMQNWPIGNVIGGFPWSKTMKEIIDDYVKPTPAEFEDFNKRAYQTMKPSLELAMDLPTFLAELKDLPSLFDSNLLKKMGFQNLDVKEVTRKLKGMKGSITRWAQDTKVEKESFTKALAGDFLGYSFGIAPTIADAKAIWKGVTEMDKRLDDLLRRAGTPCTGHASEVLVRSSHTVTYQQNTWSDYMHYFYKGGELKLTATCAYTYVLGNVQAMSNHVKRMRAYLQILGFNNPLRTIWELTPFSFVIDWFIPIGDFLEQFSFDYFDSTVSVEEYCISWKTTVPHVVRVEFERSTTSARSKVCTFWYDIYHRQRAIPNDDKFGLRFDSRFGTKQVLLSGALLTSIFGH